MSMFEKIFFSFQIPFQMLGQLEMCMRATIGEAEKKKESEKQTKEIDHNIAYYALNYAVCIKFKWISGGLFSKTMEESHFFRLGSGMKYKQKMLDGFP